MTRINYGFTLIEVLIAVVILTGGILGLAGLQATTLRNNQSAYFRSQATQLAYDMSDRLRSNGPGVAADNYNDKAQNHRDCEANTCTPAQMAAEDIFQWNAALSSLLTGLPGGVGVVCKDSTPSDGTGTTSTAAKACDNLGGVNGTYAIKIWWDDDRSGNLTRFVMSFQP